MVVRRTDCISRETSRNRNSELPANRQSNRFSLLQRLSLTLTGFNYQSHIEDGDMIERQFNDLLNEPVSEQDQHHFRHYFGRDISEKTFTTEEFSKLLQVGSTLGQRLLLVFSRNETFEKDSIPGLLVIRIIRLLWNYLTSVKALILFKLFDENNDDKITINEIRTFYNKYLTEFRIFQNQERLKEVVDIFLQGFFPSNNNNNNEQVQELNFDQFYQILKQKPNVFKSLYLLGVPYNDKEDENEYRWYQRGWTYIKNNMNRMAFIILYSLAVISLIVYRITSLKNKTIWQIIARVGGILVNFNFAVAITLMLKQCMTIIRRIYYLRFIIPVDDHIDAHRYVGTGLFISALIHSLGHIIHFATHTNECSLSQAMFTTAARIGWIGHSAPITGDILCIILLIMFICSLQCIRQRPGFYRLFYSMHLLFWPMFVLLIIHAEEFWKWAVGPMSLLLIEKIYLLKRHLPNYGRTRLISIQIEDPNVITLNIERPKHFTFHAGEYINVCLPSIARNEWHPFTISSGPERNDILRINISKKKNWTRKVYEYFQAMLNYSTDKRYPLGIELQTMHHGVYMVSNHEVTSNEIKFSDEDKDAVISIEGPFSTCTSYIFDCEHVVLIGAGIGITPYISILESLIQQIRQQRSTCHQCNASNYNHSELTIQKLKKVDFIWVNRDLGNFSWFRNILEELEHEQQCYLNTPLSNPTHTQEQRSRYLDIHLYCTVLRSNDQAMLGNLPYDLISNMYASIQQQDMHTQLKTQTHVGRPPWKLLFPKFKAENQSTNVFFTGNLEMGNVIKGYCDEFKFPFRREPGF